MNVLPVDGTLYVRALINRNIPYIIINRQIDNQSNRGQKPNIPPRQSSLLTKHNVMTSDISIQPPHSKDMTMGNTFRQEHIPIPTPIPRCDRNIKQHKSNRSPLHKYPYNQDIRDRNNIIQPQSPSLVRHTLDYTKRQNYQIYEGL